MDEHDYVYQLRPLIVPAVLFLILFPLVIGGVHFFSTLPILELRVLIGIYVVAALGILSLWIVGKSKHVQIKEGQIVFQSLLGKHTLEPQDIRRVAFYFDQKGQEVAQIRTEDELYYVSEFYFPFPELMSDLENFIMKYDLRSNLESYAGLIK
ncbi:hypothetical protein E4K67_26085 [Desulfosporosinus fructosivorans]|uniref:Uncharacterized protein n=1 Tax=Desulfosporosinus fructosivorans TaxID=2018669 RepID=A0A4Z0QX12_9FIRM|nr:hypothetical protein [Desulfosporosinus fructosivorans]TGE35322.1 hypothetical protein E4K67_26085 [Desulfosporosinus fructosivorans]